MPDEPDDWSDPGTPLPPEDRLWRHPSEVARTSAPTPPVVEARKARHSRRGLVSVAVLSGLTGAAATVMVLAAVGSLSPRTIERAQPAKTTSMPPTAAVTLTASSAAASVAPAVVQLSVTVGNARRAGSGVVVREDGLIITSEALLADADAVTVTWPSGRTAPGTVHGQDDMTGLAAVSVEGSGFEIGVGDGDPPAPGERAITVGGSASSAGPTLTQGVIGATSTHADPEEGRLLGLIETDQPVPDWADGGALVDGEGHLLGVCLTVPDKTTGFAVPMDVAERVAEDLSTMGRVDRGWLGVRGSASDATGDTPVGVRVDEVAPDSPADDAGVAPGDVLTSVDGHTVRSLADVSAALTLTRPGDEITVRRARGEQVSTVDIALDPAPPPG